MEFTIQQNLNEAKAATELSTQAETDVFRF